MESFGKTRIAIPGRSEGDGMENTPTMETDSWSTVHTPKSSKIHFKKNFPPSHVRPKEAKFVPYEPYKAAVSPIVPCPSSPSLKKPSSNLHDIVDSQRVNSLAESIIKLYSETEAHGDAPVVEDYGQCGCHLCTDCDKKMKQLEEKVNVLERENKELTSQYHVQTEVNCDLKKMLVAALGEDVQLKVQFMTEDKAHLGKEILRLSEEIDASREEMEKLDIQCNIWESKFKASSLMVKELAQWKASLSCKLRESLRGTDSLLDEHELLFEQLSATHRTLQNTLAAFDSSTNRPPASSVTSLSLSGLARELHTLSCTIQERLLGKLYCSSQPSAGFKYVKQPTRAENLVHQILKSFEQNSMVPNSERRGRVPADPRKVACRALPHLCEKDSMTVSFCKHCCGDVKIL